MGSVGATKAIELDPNIVKLRTGRQPLCFHLAYLERPRTPLLHLRSEWAWDHEQQNFWTCYVMRGFTAKGPLIWANSCGDLVIFIAPLACINSCTQRELWGSSPLWPEIWAENWHLKSQILAKKSNSNTNRATFASFRHLGLIFEVFLRTSLCIPNMQTGFLGMPSHYPVRLVLQGYADISTQAVYSLFKKQP